MKKAMTKKQKIVLGVLAAVILIVLIVLAKSFGLFGGSEETEEAAYVTPVSVITGVSGKVNRFSGIVESQETWKVDKNPEYVVSEIYVAAGDEVKAGDPLFTYDQESFESSLGQAQIDMERLQAEKEALLSTIAQLQKEKSQAPSSEQANYTIQIQQQELESKQKDLEIKSKQLEIDKLNDNIANATVTSGIDGVVQSVNTGEGVSYGYEDTSFIKIMKTGNLRIKGSVNEQNIGQLYEGMAVTVCSRVDETVWNGTITTIDRENQNTDNNNYYYGDSANRGTTYPFYVELEDSSGLMLGQHVYVKEQGSEETDGIWLDMGFVDETDPEKPFVWADNGSGRLEKRSVVIGERDDEMCRLLITEGLAYTDAIAYPDETLKAGKTCLNTAAMSEEDMTGGAGEDMMMDSGMAVEG